MAVYQEVARACWARDIEDPAIKAKVESETAAANSAHDDESDKALTQSQTAEGYAKLVSGQWSLSFVANVH